jgi:hypothetical protein
MDSLYPHDPQSAAVGEAGWTRRFTAPEPRLSEMAALYRSLGLDVQLGEATPEPGQECLACTVDPSVRTIYTRPLTRRGRKPPRPRSIPPGEVPRRG